MDIVTVSFILSIISVILFVIMLFIGIARSLRIKALCRGLEKFTKTVTENITQQNLVFNKSDEALLDMIRDLYATVNLLSISAAANSILNISDEDAQKTVSDLLQGLAAPGEELKVIQVEDDDEQDEIMKLGDLIPPQ